MAKQSAGILAYRKRGGDVEVLLVHPGGPFFTNRDEGVWSVPKGEYDGDEEALAAAIREFKEETGFDIDGDFTLLQPITQKNGKVVTAWAIEKDLDVTNFVSNTCTIEWPYKSGRQMEIPEVDKVEWLSIADAKVKINERQVGLIEELVRMVNKI